MTATPQCLLCCYAVSTDPDPLQADTDAGNAPPAALTIAVSNDTHALVECLSITFEFTLGKDAKDLTEDARGITISKPEGWSVEQRGGVFTATPDTPGDGMIGAAGLTFTLSNIKVNDQPGTFDLKITEVAAQPKADPPAPEESRTAVVRLAKFPAHFTVGELDAEPRIVEQGGATTLSWAGTGGATYELQYADADGDTVTITHPEGEPDQPLPPIGSYTIGDLQLDPTIFYLVVTLQVPGQDEPTVFARNCPVTVKAPKPAINYFNIEAEPVAPGRPPSFKLSWDVVGAFQITYLDNDGQPQRLDHIPDGANSYRVYPARLETVYTLSLIKRATGEPEGHQLKDKENLRT
jgi:hypothetical protein